MPWKLPQFQNFSPKRKIISMPCAKYTRNETKISPVYFCSEAQNPIRWMKNRMRSTQWIWVIFLKTYLCYRYYVSLNLLDCFHCFLMLSVVFFLHAFILKLYFLSSWLLSWPMYLFASKNCCQRICCAFFSCWFSLDFLWREKNPTNVVDTLGSHK